MLKGKEFIECKTQKEVDECGKNGDIAIVRSGDFVLCDNSTARLYGNSTATLCGNSTARLYDDSTARLYDDSTATLCGNSTARLYDNSTATLCGNSTARLYDNSTATLYGYTAVHKLSITSKANIIGSNGVIIEPPNISGIDDYCERYPIKQDGDYIYLYKAVGSSMKSFYDNKTEYPESGIIKTDKLAPKEAGSCAEGLHFSYYDWAVNFGLLHGDFIILKAKIQKDRIVVSPDCDGKVRTDEAEIVEVINDWQHYKPDFEEGK